MAWDGSDVIPCRVSPEKWEDPHYRYKAIQECESCPILTECRERFLPLLSETEDAQCVVGGVSLFHRYNKGGFSIHRSGGLRLKAECDRHNFYASGSARNPERVYRMAAEHSANPVHTEPRKKRISERHYFPRGENEKNCVICGVEMNPGRRGKKFCSNRCKQTDRRIKTEAQTASSSTEE